MNILCTNFGLFLTFSFCFLVNDDFAIDKLSRKDTNVIERQGFVLPALGVPFIAAALPAAGAAAIGIYGAYGDEIATLYNSFFSKCILDLFCREIVIIRKILILLLNFPCYQI